MWRFCQLRPSERVSNQYQINWGLVKGIVEQTNYYQKNQGKIPLGSLTHD